MRPIERIPIFIKNINYDKLEERWGIDIPQTLRNAIFINQNKSIIYDYWCKYSDLRFGQMLINLGLVPDKMKIWLDEENNILIDQGCKPREVLLWGRNFDANNNRLPNTEWILIKDMNFHHIKAILNDVDKNKYKIPLYYTTILTNELLYRESKLDNFGLKS